MVFKRRDRQPLGARMRQWLAPRKGWRRGIAYLGKRMQRLPDSPESIARGFACGVLASFTPFFGFHFFAAAFFAWITRANIFASAIGTFFGNPITFPFIMVGSLQTGLFIMGVDTELADGLHDMSFFDKVAHFFTHVSELMLPYLVGGFIPGIISAVIAFYLIRPLVASYQRRRREKLRDRARARLSAETDLAE